MNSQTLKLLKRGIPIYLMILPGVLYFLLFRYLPMFGLVIAFKDYDPFSGIFGSPWVGFDNFERLFRERDFLKLLFNTLTLSSMNLFFYFPVPIIAALMLNEVKKVWLKKTIQTTIYLPHFVSWVVVVSMTILLFSTQDGSINNLLSDLGMKKINLMTNPDLFRPLYLFQNIWKEAGYSAIIFIAALASIDPTMYEAAIIDGANRWQQVFYINLPALKSTIVILFILRLGQVMDVGFEQIFLLQNGMNLSVSDVFDTYVYRTGILNAQYSFSTVVGLFKSLVGLVLILGSNYIAKKSGEEGIF